MDLISTLLIAISLSLDCFAVSIAVGASQTVDRSKAALVLALLFGGFQSGMNVIGWAAGRSFHTLIQGWGPWIAFALLAAIGVNMIREGLGKGEGGGESLFRPAPLLVLAIATSIDSLGTGFGFAVLRAGILIPALLIGTLSALFSSVGVLGGTRLSRILGARTELAGGAILIGIGIRILLEGLSNEFYL